MSKISVWLGMETELFRRLDDEAREKNKSIKDIIIDILEAHIKEVKHVGPNSR